MVDVNFFRTHMRLLAGGMLLTFSSTFGQTYFIAIFAGHFRSEFGLSHGDYGGLYMLGTLSSAATLIYAGTLADRMNAAKLGAVVLVCLAAVCVAVSAIPSWLWLGFAFYGLRLFGQGMTTHVAITSMAKWFDAHRGRAIAMAALGHPVAEAILPLVAVGLIALIGWRATWLVSAGYLLLVAVPLLLWLLRGAGHDAMEHAPSAVGGSREMRQWKRGEVLGDPLFYAIMLGVLAPPFIGTGIFFHQVHIIETKGWTLASFAAGFPIYAGASILSGLATGWATDIWGARRLLPVYLLPMLAGLLIMSLGQHPLWIFAYMILGGITQGAGTAFLGALWVELYGRENLGSIRSLAFASMVFASALSPFIMGALIDKGVKVESQLLWMAAYCALSVPFFLALVPVFHRREAA